MAAVGSPTQPRPSAPSPLLEGNHAQLLTYFKNQLGALVAAVEGARRYVRVKFYILSLDSSTSPFFTALEAAV